MKIKKIFATAVTVMVSLASTGMISANAETGDVYNENSFASDQNNSASDGQKNLVAYYSASGTTERIAGYIAEEMNADVFVIAPKNEYTSADLNWTDSSSRVVTEHNNPNTRHVELTKITPDNFDEYDNVFIGYPIWWGEAAWVADDFVKENDFTGKNVIPFCTSASSPLGQSGTKLASMAGTGNWLEGIRFSGGSSKDTVQNWASELNLPKTEKPGNSENPSNTENTNNTSLGDVNRDGKIDSNDAVLVLQDYASYLVSGKNSISIKTADMNNDGKIDSKDAIQILIIYANNIVSGR